MNLTIFVIIAIVCSAIVGWLTIPTIVIIAKRKRLFDTPSSRKVHSRAIPRLGGMAFFPATMVGFCLSLGIRYGCNLDISILREGQFLCEFTLLSCGMFLLFMVGVADDMIGVSPRGKFMVQIATALALTLSGLYIKNLDGIFGIYNLGVVFGTLLTILVVVFIVNAFNLLDGLDGLCSGVGIVILSLYGGWFMYLGEVVYAMLVFSMVGVLLVFFFYNTLGGRFKIFMGDTGSLTLGLMIAFCSLKFLNYEDCPYAVYEFRSPLLIVVGILFVPLFDTVRVFTLRLLDGKSPFYPDRNHIHHKLLELGLRHIQCSAIIIVCCLGMLGLNIFLGEVLALNINLVLAIDLAVGIISIKIIERILTVKRKL